MSPRDRAQLITALLCLRIKARSRRPRSIYERVFLYERVARTASKRSTWSLNLKVLANKGKTDEAVQLFRRENQANEDALEKIMRCWSKNRLARALVKLGGTQHKTEAENLIENVGDLQVQIDAKHPRYEASLDDLVDFLFETGKFHEAGEVLLPISETQRSQK